MSRNLFLNKSDCSGIFIWNINIQKPSYILNLLIASFPYKKSITLTYSSRILKRYNQSLNFILQFNFWMLCVYTSSVPLVSIPFGLQIRSPVCCLIPKRWAQGDASFSETSCIDPYNCYPGSTAAVVCV